MYRRIHKWCCLIFVLILFGCAKEGEETRGILSKSALREQETAQTNTPSNGKQLEITDRKIIKTGNIEFQTTSISETRTRINDAINK